MPIVQIEMLEGRTTDQKREMAKGVTEAIVKALNVSPDAVRIIIREMKREDYAVAGVLQVDRK